MAAGEALEEEESAAEATRDLLATRSVHAVLPLADSLTRRVRVARALFARGLWLWPGRLGQQALCAPHGAVAALVLLPSTAERAQHLLRGLPWSSAGRGVAWVVWAAGAAFPRPPPWLPLRLDSAVTWVAAAGPRGPAVLLEAYGAGVAAGSAGGADVALAGPLRVAHAGRWERGRGALGVRQGRAPRTLNGQHLRGSVVVRFLFMYYSLCGVCGEAALVYMWAQYSGSLLCPSRREDRGLRPVHRSDANEFKGGQ
ncbi:hypothetical protein R5R35_002885 [Gryllus longicercus]|uniref:Uncharacterized protein n=1 Tax=Gryllus longicercus TaxID=2509291 RepID=A0AAN9VP47_9ORTH